MAEPFLPFKINNFVLALWKVKVYYKMALITGGHS